MIDVRDLSLQFGDFTAVRSVSFAVGKGESFGIVGESGSGKSSVLRALAGLNPPTQGRVTIDGEDVSRTPSRAFRRRVQMVFQDPYGSLHPRQTIDRILSESLIVQGMGEIDLRVARALDEVGLPAAARFRFPHQLSGGQRQRVAIARALVIEPELVLLDEPTSALDVSVQAEILNLLSDLRQARQLTYVMVGHNLAVVTHLCDRVGVMQSGEMVEQLAADTLRFGQPRHPHTRALRALTIALDEPSHAHPAGPAQGHGGSRP